MSWTDDECDKHGPLVDNVCPECPTKEQLIESRDFTGLAFRVLDEHQHGGYATKASHLGNAMRQCFEAGRAAQRIEEANDIIPRGCSYEGRDPQAVATLGSEGRSSGSSHPTGEHGEQIRNSQGTELDRSNRITQVDPCTCDYVVGGMLVYLDRNCPEHGVHQQNKEKFLQECILHYGGQTVVRPGEVQKPSGSLLDDEGHPYSIDDIVARHWSANEPGHQLQLVNDLEAYVTSKMDELRKTTAGTKSVKRPPPTPPSRLHPPHGASQQDAAFRDVEVEAMLMASAASHDSLVTRGRILSSQKFGGRLFVSIFVSVGPLWIYLTHKGLSIVEMFLIVGIPAFFLACISIAKVLDVSFRESDSMLMSARKYLSLAARCRSARKLLINTVSRSDINDEWVSILRDKNENDRSYNPSVKVLDEVRPAVRHRLAEEIDPESILSSEFDERLRDSKSPQAADS